MISEMTLIFDIANFPLLGGDVCTLSNVIWSIYIQLIRFARVCSHVNEFNVQINDYLPNLSNRAIGIIHFRRLLPNCNVSIMNWFLNNAF